MHGTGPAAADAITPEVLAAADAAAPDGEPHHERLARLPLAALQRVTRAASAGTTAAATPTATPWKATSPS